MTIGPIDVNVEVLGGLSLFGPIDVDVDISSLLERISTGYEASIPQYDARVVEDDIPPEPTRIILPLDQWREEDGRHR